MIALLCFLLTLFASLFKSKSRLEAENAALRHQLIVLQRRMRGRVHLTSGDRLFLVQLYRWFPSMLKAITIIRPETLDHVGAGCEDAGRSSLRSKLLVPALTSSDERRCTRTWVQQRIPE